MPEEKKRRSANFELLRVTAMLLIIAFHIWDEPIKLALIQTMTEGELFNAPAFYAKLLIPEFLSTLGPVADNLFILVSGFFTAAAGKKLRIDRKAGELFKQMAFAVGLLMLASAVSVLCFPRPDIRPVTVSEFNSGYWFLGYYILILASAELFLNRILEACDRERYRTVLIVLFSVFSVGWIAALANSLVSNLAQFAVGLFCYSLGGYLRTYDPLRRVRSLALALGLVCLYALRFASYYINTMAMLAENPIPPYIQLMPRLTNTGAVVPLLVSVLLFELFRRARVPDSRLILFLGKSCFMAFLVHANSFVFAAWSRMHWVELLDASPAAFCLRLAACTLGTFALCAAVYALYLGFVRLCGRLKPLVLYRDPPEP